MDPRFEQFIRERRYIVNVSPKTLVWYADSFKHLACPEPTESDLKDFVIRLRERGLKVSSCNTYSRAINAYLHWSGSPLRIPKLKEPKLTLPVFKLEDIKKFIRWRPKRACDVRLHLLVLSLLDCGLRISEALSLRWSDVDMDNLLLTIHGKGSKDRTIPFSFELRKYLARHQTASQKNERGLVFETRGGRGLDIDNCRRDVRLLCVRLGFDPPERTLHAMRHTMASNFIKQGGNVAILQRLLGHSSITTTMIYVHLNTGDLSAAVQRTSLLSGWKS
jgi:integrase/recombinase XerD